MDKFESILYIVLILGSIGWSVLKTLKKEEEERKVKKMRSRPVEANPYEEEEVRPKQKKKAKAAPQPEQKNEYFSYETMSERDFEQAFSENVEETEHTTSPIHDTPQSKIHLHMDEEEVYKGVIWSEILNRKY